MPIDPMSHAATNAAGEAKRLRPYVYGLFVLAVVLIVGEIGIAGLRDTANLRELRGQSFDIWQAVDTILRHILRVAPACALASALWYAQDYLGRLEKGELWAPSTSALVVEIGSAMAMAAALDVLIAPTILRWLDRNGAVELNLEPTPVVLGGLGLALIVIGRGLKDAIGAAGALKSENDQIV